MAAMHNSNLNLASSCLGVEDVVTEDTGKWPLCLNIKTLIKCNE